MPGRDPGPFGVTRSRADVLRSTLRVLMHRAMKRFAVEHVKAGEPPVAVYAFDTVGSAISLFGRFERDELDVLSRWLDEQPAGDGICVDVGAHVGNHALFFSRRFPKVFAFEPNPTIFRLLEINAEQARNIACFNLGLSDHPHQARFALPTMVNTGKSRIISSSDDSKNWPTVQAVRLDEVPELVGERVSLMKVDAERHELQVFKGAAGILIRDHPVVIFEQDGSQFADGTSASIDFLRSLGYRRFLTLKKSPQLQNDYLNVAARLICGERTIVREVERFDPQFYSMVIATA